MNEILLDVYWSELPIGKENAVSYAELCEMWGRSERCIRQILHDLSGYDNGDNYILIRSSSCKGFYKTDNEDEIAAYRQECLNRGRNVFAPIRKIDRVLADTDYQMNFENNLKTVRIMAGMKQQEVCGFMAKYDKAFDVSMLSKMENGVCLPTPFQLSKLAQIYGVKASELVGVEFV